MSFTQYVGITVPTQQELDELGRQIRDILVRQSQHRAHGPTREETRAASVINTLADGRNRLQNTEYEVDIRAAHSTWSQYLDFLRRQRALPILPESCSDEQLEQRIMKYQRELRKITSNMVSEKLSYDIKSMIFENIVRPQRQQVVLVAYDPEEGHKEPLRLALDICTCNESFQWFDFDLLDLEQPSSFWHCEKVGHGLLRDLVEEWYSVNTFRVLRTSAISEFLLQDRWGLDIIPQDHVRRVEYSMSLTKDEGGRRANKEGLSDDDKEILIDLNNLGRFSKDTNVRILIDSQKCMEEGSSIWSDEILALRFVEDLDYVVSGTLRKLQKKKKPHSLTCNIDQKLDLVIDQEADIGYEIWASKMLELIETQPATI